MASSTGSPRPSWGALNALWDLLSATVFVSPDVTQLPQVTTLASTSLGIVNVCYVLAFLWVAILVLGRDTIQAKYGPGELIPRLIIGLIALVIAVLVGVLVVQFIIRLGVLIVAVGIAPIALALHGTPQTEGAAKLWWRTILGTLGTVVMQAVALHTTLTIFLNPDANLPVLGLPGDPGAVMILLIVVCLLWGVIKIPGLMRRYITQARPSPMGTILRVVLVQQLTRGISRAFSSGRGAARPAPVARPASRGASRAASGWPTR
jgi:hypothetical protein